MIKEGKIGVQETIFLTTITITNPIFFTAPNSLINASGTAGWQVAIVSGAVSLLAFAFICILLKRFPGKNIIEIFSISMGRVLGFIFSFIMAASFLVGTSVLLREFTEALNIFIFPMTPPGFLSGAMVIVVASVSYLGLESIARFAKLIAYIAVFGFLLLLVLSSQHYKITNLFPVLGYGIGTTLVEGVTRSSVYSEVIIIAVFAGSLQGIEHIKKAGYISLILSGGFLTAGILSISLAFPYYSIEEMTVPMYTLTRTIKFGLFLQRLDPLFILMWSIATCITISILFYSAVSSYCKTFRLQDTRPVIFPMTVLLFSAALIPEDYPSVVYKYIEALRSYAIIVFYVFPLLALITAVIRKKKGAEADV